MLIAIRCFDPVTGKERNDLKFDNVAKIEKHAMGWARAEIQRRRTEGLKNGELVAFRTANQFDHSEVAVIRPINGDVRHFNIDPQAFGGIDSAMYLWLGEWRLATEDEELASFKVREEAKLIEAQKTLRATNAAAQALASDVQFKQAVELVHGKSVKAK